MRKLSVHDARFGQEDRERDDNIEKVGNTTSNTRKRKFRMAALVASVMVAGCRKYMKMLATNKLPTFNVARHKTLD